MMITSSLLENCTNISRITGINTEEEDSSNGYLVLTLLQSLFSYCHGFL